MPVPGLGDVVDGVRLVLERRDRREAQSRLTEDNIKEGLRALTMFGEQWSWAAEATRSAVLDWRNAGCPDDDSTGVVRSIADKLEYVERFVTESQSFIDVLSMYNPELGRALRALPARSSQNLKRMVPELVALRTDSQALNRYLLEFDRRTTEVRNALERLRVFVTSTYPLGVH